MNSVDNRRTFVDNKRTYVVKKRKGKDKEKDKS